MREIGHIGGHYSSVSDVISQKQKYQKRVTYLDRFQSNLGVLFQKGAHDEVFFVAVSRRRQAIATITRNII